GIASRSNDGQITFHDWHPVGVEEYGYVAPDPLDPNMIYGGKLTRYDKRTGQIQNIAPEAVRSGKYRFLRTAPVLFSPVDPKTLYYAGNVIFKTQNGGQSWEIISPDLSRESWDVPESIGVYKNENMKSMPRRGVVYTLAPSPLDVNLMWAGTDDGLIHVTRDGGKNWVNVTPPEITSWSKVSIMEASHFDKDVAYAAVNRIRLDDARPHIYKTTDGGKTWKEIVSGLPNDPINSVKEDLQSKGLLFAGSERFVNVSFDDGDHWQSLRLNMPCTSVRDLVIKDDDLVIGTHGRSFWILDDITALRQAKKEMAVQNILYKPQAALRIRWSMNPDTPLPQEEPGGQNPPDGAVIDYYLKADAKDVTLEILNDKNEVVRKYSSKDKPYKIPELNIPLYWIRPQQILSAARGHHRFLWDVQYAPVNADVSFPMSAIYQNTAPDQTAPWAMPGDYKARLTVDGQRQEQKFTVKIDPRVQSSKAQLQEQFDLSMICYNGRKNASDALAVIVNIENQVKELKTTPAVENSLKDFKAKLTSLKGGSGFRRDPNSVSWGSVAGNSGQLLDIMQGTDMPVTNQAKQGVNELQSSIQKVSESWKNFLATEVPNINALLKKEGLKELSY
ncbi:MAG TPA: hypothetical protein VL728_11720, partial [Cyclobacteriaceae bacterium]|nr:hypothetical protein [Cyclobacteriaceae bacterium]